MVTTFAPIITAFHLAVYHVQRVYSETEVDPNARHACTSRDKEENASTSCNGKVHTCGA